MPNLNGANCVRQVPSFTYKQVQALERLHRLDPESQVEILSTHGDWALELAYLNKANIEDIMYTLATGEYELEIDAHEQYLLDKVNYYKSHNTLLFTELNNALNKYRQFREQVEE